MGKQVTTEAGHFILKDAPGVAEALGTETPTELKIYFPFDDIDRNFPTYRTLFSASSMTCQGDGQHILHAINPTTGQATVKDGVCILPFTERMADNKLKSHNAGDKMPCPALREPGIYAKCAMCKNRGILLVMLQAVPRMAYFQISTGSIVNLQELPQQMLNIQELIYELTGKRKLAGVPFILRRVLRSMSPVKKDHKGNPTGRVRVDKYVLQLEIEPEYMISLIRAQRRLIDPMARYALSPGQPEGSIDIVDSPSVISEPPQWEAPVSEDADFEEVEIETTDETQPEPDPVLPPEPTPQPTKGKQSKIRPLLSPLDLKAALEKKVSKSALADPNTGQLLPVALHPFGSKTANLLSAKFQEAFKPVPEAETMYHASLKWLTGYDSATDLSAAMADALLDWLLNGNKDDRWKATVTLPAPEEAYQVYQEAVKAEREAAIAAGQLDLFGQPAGESELNKFFPRGEFQPGGKAAEEVTQEEEIDF
jgi:hypothetical protein